MLFNYYILFLAQATQPVPVGVTFETLVYTLVAAITATLLAVKAAATFFPGVDSFFSPGKKREQPQRYTIGEYSEACGSTRQQMKDLHQGLKDLVHNINEGNKAIQEGNRVVQQLAVQNQKLHDNVVIVLQALKVEEEVRRREENRQRHERDHGHGHS